MTTRFGIESGFDSSDISSDSPCVLANPRDTQSMSAWMKLDRAERYTYIKHNAVLSFSRAGWISSVFIAFAAGVRLFFFVFLPQSVGLETSPVERVFIPLPSADHPHSLSSIVSRHCFVPRRTKNYDRSSVYSAGRGCRSRLCDSGGGKTSRSSSKSRVLC